MSCLPGSASGQGLFGWRSPPSAKDRGGCVEVLGVPSDFGNSYVSGTRFGPEAIRMSSLKLARPAATGFDHGDVEVFDGADWAQVIERARHLVADIASSGAIPIVLGGDHAVSYAAMAALDRWGPVDIVWFDAHTDFCAWQESDWHNHKQVLRRIAGLPHCAGMLVIGHRGMTYFDESVQWPGLTVMTSEQLHQSQQLPIEWLLSDRPLYISVDIDVLDPCAAPGTGHPVPGGLGLPMLCNLVETLARKRRIIGADIMEVNPVLDEEAMTSLAAASVLSTLVNALPPSHYSQV